MRQEYHRDENGNYKQLYPGWSTLTASVWLPGLSELVGHDPNKYNATNGCYNSAMQGINAADYYWTDPQGGAQFTYFKQYNTSGGGQRIWDVCGREASWIRSPYCGTSPHAWVIIETLIFDSATNSVATSTYAVHPAVLYNPERPIEQTAFFLR